jgi:hypothetical protein
VRRHRQRCDTDIHLTNELSATAVADAPAPVATRPPRAAVVVSMVTLAFGLLGSAVYGPAEAAPRRDLLLAIHSVAVALVASSCCCISRRAQRLSSMC